MTEIAEYSGGTAYLTVLPSLAGFGAKVREQLAKEDPGGLTVQIKPQVDKAAAAARGAEAGGAFGDAMRARIDAALKDLPKPKIDADSSEADRKIAELRGRLEELRGKRIGVDIDAGAALAEMAAIKADLDEVGRKSPNIQVKIDALKAAADLAGIRAEVSALDGKNINIKVDDQGSASQAAGSIGGLKAAGIALGPAIIPVAAAVAAALGAIGIGAVAGAAGIGVLVAAFHGIGTAVGALTTANQQAGQNAAQAAAQQISAANSVTSAQDGVRNAVRGVADAQRAAGIAATNAAATVATAQRGVADAYIAAGIAETAAAQAVANAQQALATAYASAAQAMTAALQAVTSAEQSLANAQRQVTQAQIALTDARLAATRQLEAYKNQVKDGALSERAAQLAITKAKLELDKVMANPRATQLQRDEAQLTYDQSVQQLTDVQERNKTLAQEKAAADKAGVEGSKQVVAAQNGVTSATQAVASAQQQVATAQANVATAAATGAAKIASARQALSNAEAAQAETKRANTEKITVAQQALQTAERNQSETARAGAESVVKAQESVVTANRALTGALAQQAAQAAQTSAANNALAEAMAGLSPAGREFVHFIVDELNPRLKELQQTAQQGLLPGVQAGLRAIFPIFPLLNDLVRSVAETIGDMARRAGEALNSPFWRGFITFLTSEAGPSIRTFGTIMGNLLTGFAGILEAFSPIWDKMGADIQGFSEKFAAFGQNLKNNPQFQEFLQYAMDNGPRIMDMLGQVAMLFVHIGEGLAPLGPPLLIVVDLLARFFNLFPPSVLAGMAIAVTGFWLAWKLGIVSFKAVAESAKIESAVTESSWITRTASWIGTTLARIGKWAIDTIANFAKVAIEATTKAAVTSGKWIASEAAILLEATTKGVTWVTTKISQFFAASVSAVKEAAASSIAWVKTEAAILLEAITKGAQWLKLKLAQFLAASLSAVKEAASASIAWVAAEGKILLEATIKGAQWLKLKLAQFLAASASATFEAGAAALSWALATASMIADQATKGAIWLGAWIATGVAAAASSVIEAGVALGAWVAASAGMIVATGGIILAIGAVIAIGYLLITHWDSVKAAAAATWRAIKDGWDMFIQGFKDAWTVLKVVGNAIVTFFSVTIPDGFKSGIALIKTAWDKLMDIAKIPVNFVINTVYNSGIVPLWNGVASVFGLGTLKAATPLAEGGVLPGYSPGRDSVPALLSPGEGILVPEAVRALGPSFIHDTNRYYSGGRSSGGLGYAAGGVVETKGNVTVPGAWDIISGLFTDPVGSVKKLFAGVVESATRIPGTGLIRDALGKIPGKIIDGAVEAAKKIAAAALSAVTSGGSSAVTGSLGVGAGGGAGTEKWRGVGLQALGIAGQGPENIGKLLMQMGTESGGRTNAINKQDINWTHGTPSVGLMQVIQPTYRTHHHPSYNAPPFEYGVSEDPLSNILASIRYTVAQYHTLAAGWQGHGYDSGGWLPPGKTLTRNDTGEWERILTGGQWRGITDLFERLGGHGRRHGGYDAQEAGANGQPINIHVNPGADRDEGEIADMVSRRLSFAMRCGG